MAWEVLTGYVMISYVNGSIRSKSQAFGMKIEQLGSTSCSHASSSKPGVLEI